MGFSDDFNDNYLDPTKWEILRTGGAVYERNQRLEFVMPYYGSYRLFVGSVESQNVKDSKLSVVMNLGGCDEVSIRLANSKYIDPNKNPDNLYRIGLINVYDPEYPDIGDIDLRVHNRVNGRWKTLYSETIGKYPEDRDMTVMVGISFEGGKASFYIDERFIVEEYYALPSYENYFYMTVEASPDRCGTAWFDDVTFTIPPTLTINVDKTEGRVGDTFTFSGYLTQNGEPITYTYVTLYIDGKAIGAAMTDENGRYEAPWIPTEPGTYKAHTEA